MKLRLLQLLTGKFGPVITPIVSGVIGAIVATFYSKIVNILVSYLTTQTIFIDIWNNLDPSLQMGFDSKNIGIGVAGICYIVIQEWLNKFFINNVKDDQRKLNEILPASEHIKVDGIPLKETEKAKEKVSKFDY